ncbi:MAG: ArsR/SmtB family transcription factor [Rhodothermales bacterium]
MAKAPDQNAECAPDGVYRRSLPDGNVVEESVRLLKGLADATRLSILCLLREGEVCVHALTEALDVSQSAVSHQLRVLREARLVEARRGGRHVYYRLADDHVRAMLDGALAHGEEVC